MREKVLGVLLLLLDLAALGAWVMIVRTCYKLSRLRNSEHPLLRMERKPVEALLGWVILATPAAMLASSARTYGFVFGAVWAIFPIVYCWRICSRWKREISVRQ